MRRNLRLDWRALALLGALLSIIIDWPGLVYAMPTILPAVTAVAAKAAPIDTLNVIKSDNILSSFPADQTIPVTEDHSLLKDCKMLNEFSNNQITTTSTPPTLVTSLYAKETVTDTKQQPQQRLSTINEEQQVNEKYISISNKQINDKIKEYQVELTATRKTNDQQISEEAEEEEELTKSLLNTHSKNSTINTMSLYNCTNTQQPTTSTTLSTTESSAKIQSTLMPTTSADQSYDQQAARNNNNLNTKNILNNFKLSSSHHLAILSRTERSIRSRSSASVSTPNVSSWRIPPVFSRRNSERSHGSSAVGGVLVRRSPDMSVVKSKRLNNSRNLHHKNNLDRNERSTVSHLSGPSRKIQLYIKTHFLQLLPDGTVNGTHDEQCDYTRDFDNHDLHDQTF